METAEIWSNFQQRLYRFVLQRVKDEATAKDLLQDLFVKIHLNIDQLKTTDKLLSWTYTITRNVITDHFRARQKEIAFEALLQQESDASPFFALHDFSGCMHDFAQAIPEHFRHILEETVLGDVSIKDYAAQNNMNYHTAKSHAQRARKKLKAVFLECCNIETDRYGNILEMTPQGGNEGDSCTC